MSGGPIKIGSFNLCKFGRGSEKNLPVIAEIILGEGFDILAMQEVFHPSAAERLKPLLGSDWEVKWDRPDSCSVQAAEGYAFLWKKSRFRLATGQTQEDARPSGRGAGPHIWRQYSRDPALTGGQLIRDPYYIRLESVQGWYEIRLINTHITFFGDKKEYHNRRRQELETLLGVYGRIADWQYASCRPSYTFLLGDYNLNLPRPWTGPPYLEETADKTENGRLVKRILTLQDQLTTLKAAQSGQEEAEPGYANNFDHVSLDCLRFEGMRMPVCTQVESVERYCGGDFAQHRNEISDHLPICLQFSLN